LAAAGAGRGYVEVKETFTRADGATPLATFIDRDGSMRLAAADKVRIEYPTAFSGLVDSAGLPYCGPSLEGSRQNIIENGNYEADTVGSNALISTIARDATNVRSGAWALKVTPTNADASGVQWLKRDGTKMLAVAGTAYSSGIWLYAPAASVGKQMRFVMSWYTAADAAINSVGGTTETLVAGWQRIVFNGQVAPGTTGKMILTFSTVGAQGVFDVWIDVAQFEAGAFVSNAIPTGTAAVTRAADSLSVPFNFGPMDCTVLARVARPVYADAVGDILLSPGVFSLGSANPLAAMFFVQSARSGAAFLADAGGNQQPAQAIPAGAALTFAAQFKDFGAGKTAKVAMNTGTAYTGFSDLTRAITAYGNQTLVVGSLLNQQLYSVLLDLIFARGQRTLAEMLAIP
jgi:hypothetical protein